jgi:hypothetical protein
VQRIKSNAVVVSTTERMGDHCQNKDYTNQKTWKKGGRLETLWLQGIHKIRKKSEDSIV